MDKRIDKLVERDPCYSKLHDFPNPRNYGYGTIAHCGNCGLKARLDNDQRDGDTWVHLYPAQYVKV